MKCRQKSVRELLTFLAVFLFALTGGSGQSATQDKPAQPIDLNKLANDYFTPLLASKKVSAAAVVVIDKDGPVFSMAYGSGDLKSSVWRVASVSKALIAIAIMRLVEERKVDLDTDVNRYLKSFQVPATFAQPITLRQLLEHRSGLVDRFVGDGFARDEQPPMQLVMKKFLPARVYPPNEVEFYSNYGYGLIGAVIEDVTGVRFEDYMAANVLKPLGMNRSSFAQPLAADAAAATVPGKWWYQHAAPAGGLATTVEDMTAFLSATMHGDSAVVSKSSFAAMTRPQEAASGLIHRLGYWTGRDHGQQLVGASGDSGSFHAVMTTIPAQGVGIVVLVSGDGGTLAWGFYSRFLDAQFGPVASPQSNAPLLQPKAGDYERSARFAGLYRTVRYPHHELSKTFILLDLTRVSVERDGALRFHGARWIQTGALQFTTEDGSETVSFKEDAAGRIKFLDDKEERIGWYESGYANIPFYSLFTLFFGIALWRVKTASRWLCGLALCHSVGWLAIVLTTGPENLIFGLPLALKAVLCIGTVVPLMAASAIYSAWRNRTFLTVTSAVVMACYIPFVLYWKLYAWV